MSKDIRSYFIQGKKPSKPPPPKIDDDDDVIPESPDVQIKNHKKTSRKKRVLSDDSDEEMVSTKKKKSDVGNKKVLSSTSKKKTPQKSLKEVSAADVFGGSIKRTEPLKKKKTETGIHSDDEFEKSLLELDEGKTITLKDETKSPIKTMTQTNHTDAKVDDKNVSPEVKHNKAVIKELSSSDELKAQMSSNKKIKKHADHKNEIKIEEKSSRLDSKKKLNDTNFMEFIEGDSTNEDDKKSKKANNSLNESVLTDEERHERKMQSRMLYKSYLNRSGPKNLGAKEIPEGDKNCLKDCAFLLTGVLESFERDEICNAITKYGGVVKNGISKKVTHVLAGDDAGPAKTAKAQELGIKIINEDEFLEMIRKRSKKHPNNKDDIKSSTSKENGHNRKPSKHKDKEKNDLNALKDNRDIKKESKCEEDKLEQSEVKNKKVKSPAIKNLKSEESAKSKNHDTDIIMSNTNNVDVNSGFKKESEDNDASEKMNGISSASNEFPESKLSLMWVEKYKPQNLKQIIGQHGDNSNVKKLSNWLSKWYINRKLKLPKPSPWAKNDDGGYFKAALLSGPPGVGKTTAVTLVCKELGFDAVEFNASDTRNKTLLKQQIGELLNTNSLSGYAKGEVGKQAVSKKHVLVMDEVDGMAGNEDRGGMQELLSLIKSSSVPIVCTCNDRQSQKMRSLLNYVYDIKFQRPQLNQIKAAMLSICSREGVKIPPDVLTQLITAANRDVRQTLNLLSMWAVESNPDPERLKRDAGRIKLDVKLGPWEAIHRVFTAEEHKNMTLMDKSDLFFTDYSLIPLFVQENYLSVVPHCPKNEMLERVSRTADSISAGDLVESRIRGAQAWGLLPIQAMYSSVIPGHEMSGHIAKMINFPSWLGKNSRANKMHRLCQEIHAHTRLSTSGSKSSIFLDYCSHLRDAIVSPLVTHRADGIAAAMEVLESYHLLREDLDSLSELSLWPGQNNPTVLIDSKVKAGMTRQYNKQAPALPYAPGAVKRGRGKGAERGEEGNEDEEAEEDEQEEDSDPEADALIKKKKTKEADKPNTNKQKPGSSKEKTKSGKEKGKKK